MDLRFEVLYRLAGADDAGKLETVILHADSQSDAERDIREKCGDVVIIRTKELDPELAPNQWTYNIDEAAVVFRCSRSGIERMMAHGELDQASGRFPVFTRSMLLRAVAKRMGIDLQEAA